MKELNESSHNQESAGPKMNLDESPNPRACVIVAVPHPRATTHVAEAVEPPILFILNERFKARRKVNPPA